MSKPKARRRIAILWRGDEGGAPRRRTETSRFKAVFAALADLGVDAEPIVFTRTMSLTPCAHSSPRLTACSSGQPHPRGPQPRQSRRTAARGRGARRRMSAHPDVILKMGTKGGILPSYTHDELGLRHGPLSNAEAIRAQLPARLAAGPRVVKRNRGNGGESV